MDEIEEAEDASDEVITRLQVQPSIREWLDQPSRDGLAAAKRRGPGCRHVAAGTR